MAWRRPFDGDAARSLELRRQLCALHSRHACHETETPTRRHSQPWLFAWVADDGVWQLVPGQSYDPAAGLITAPANRLGTYVLMTAAMRQHWFPQILLR